MNKDQFLKITAANIDFIPFWSRAPHFTAGSVRKPPAPSVPVLTPSLGLVLPGAIFCWIAHIITWLPKYPQL